MSNFDSIQSYNEIIENKNKRPLEKIIRETFSQFKIEDIMHVFFSLIENKNDLIINDINTFEVLSNIDKNIEFQLKIFLEVLRENYEEQYIIQEFYKYLFNVNIKNDKNVNKNYISLEKNGKMKKKEYFKKIKNNLIIPIKSKFKLSLKDKKNVIGFLYKNKNNIYFYYPIQEQNIFLNENMKKIIEDTKKILFVCIKYLPENENNIINSYIIYDLERMDFSFRKIHSSDMNDYLHSIKIKYEFELKDEIMEIIPDFLKMNINSALIIKEYV